MKLLVPLQLQMLVDKYKLSVVGIHGIWVLGSII